MVASKADGYNTRTFLEKFMDVLLCRGDLANEETDKKPVSLSELFRYASKKDRCYVGVGFVLAILVGIIMPLNCVAGGLYANFYLKDLNHIGNELLWRKAMYLCIGYLVVGCVLFVLCYLQHYFLFLASRNIVERIRKEFVTAVLRQNAMWQDENNAGTITSQLNENIAQIEDGIGDKIGMLARGVSMFIASAAFAFAFSWRITLVCVGVGPVSAITMAVMSKLSSSSMQGMMSVSGAVGAIAEEAVMNVKTVAACNGQEHMVKTKGSSDENGEEMKSCEGRLEFRDVYFKYPTRETPILKGLSWYAEPGETIAFVGKSGCGKSTSIGLLTRLYDCNCGSMTLDGRDIRSIKLSDLRKMIGIVQQEPCLFNGTIRENIVLGRDISDEQAEEAARIANAHDFIIKLEKGYDTMIGTGGIALSGGQKQRLAIARAVAAQPKILLLDEATSALDSESEKIVQLALNRASLGRTTIVIAHRLSTLKDVQRIYAIEEGEVVEEGTHYELLERQGVYSNLAKAQEVGIDIGGRKRKISESFDPHAHSIPIVRHDLRASGVARRSVSSIVSQPIEYLKQKPNTQPSRGGGIFRVYLSCLRSRPVFWVCLIGSIMRGMELPFCAYFNGFTYRALDQTIETFAPFMWLAIGLFLFLAIYSWVFLTISIGFGGWSSESFSSDMRVGVLRSLLSQNAEFFDRPQYSNAACVTELSSKPPDVQACLDYRFMLMVNNLCAVGVCIALSVVACWPSGVAMTILITLFTASMWFTSNRVSANMLKKAELDKTPELSVEIFEQTRTIQLLAVEPHFIKKFGSYQEAVKSEERLIAIYQGIQFALTQCYIYFSDMVTYAIGATMIFHGYVDAVDTVVSATSANFAGWAVIFASAAFGDFVRSHFAAQALYSIIDSCEKVEGGETPIIEGSVRVQKVEFSYPSRPDVKVAKNLNLIARNGQAVALVGASGCGKSTVIQLLERFYDPDSGNIKIDDNDLGLMCKVHLRKNIALVGQEPVLFRGSIYENITLGMDNVSIEDVREVCKQANASNFIESFPEGYDTDVGEKGGNLSGGQKQRIAIARALIRKPKIILLDEATSALDTESEKIVQAALNEASHGRTSITIAHRLSTVRHADRIYYIENGSVVEYGTHEELIEAEGKYSLLVKAQQLARPDRS
ncbi:hypothetical protein Y032_0007g3527 [Ancylostoma ceylanicum]|uniref:ABC transporter, ATP-binding protein n=3 Tax=Ancylostoma ceylanicum TaxID=53326 RepID=A0A016VN14_9BILA|nr:hypothetical protein Y032_0007g3527 [Ancylostoma ceylanicum]